MARLSIWFSGRSRQLAASRKATVRRAAPHERPLRCEPLEDRALLSVDPWPAFAGLEQGDATVSPIDEGPIHEASLNVAVISDAVAQAEQIRQAAAPDTIAIVYDADTMTTAGLVELLRSVSAAHDGALIAHLGIVAHGAPGEIELGPAAKLNTSTLSSEALQCAHVRSLLSDNSTLCLYSCSVAAGVEGKHFVEELAAVTGANILASDDPVGTVIGADFEWEYYTDQRAVNTKVLFQNDIQGISGLCLPTYDVAAATKYINPLLYYPRDITQDGSDETFCNWYVGDVLTYLGVYVPRDQTAGSYWPSYVNAGHVSWVAGTFDVSYFDTNPSQQIPSWDAGALRHPGSSKAVVQAKPYSADGLRSYFGSSGDWLSVSAATAKSYADTGNLVVASQVGHVAIVVPAPEASSPHVAQAGLTCTIKREVSLCFTITPTYYVYSPGSTRLDPPVLISPSNGATNVPITTSFSWSHVSGNHGYRIIVSSNAAEMTTDPESSGVAFPANGFNADVPTWDQNNYPPTGTLTGDITYYWEVHAKAGTYAQSGYWQQGSFSTAAPPTRLAYSAANINTGGETTEDFNVTYEDNVAVDVSSLGGGNIRVTGPNGFSQLAAYLSVNNTNNGTPRTANYRITAPGGTWDSTDNGTYTVTILANQVRDTSGNSMVSVQAGTFFVNIPVADSSPNIGSLTDSPDPVTEGNSLTLTANDVSDDGNVVRVEFYWDADSSGTIDSQTDLLLGTDTSGADGWTCVFLAAELPTDTPITYMARAQDDSGLWSDTASTTGTINAITNKPNLAPYQSSGWSDKIVVSTWPWNQNGSSPLYSTDALCLGFSVANGDAASIGTGFTNALYIDGSLFGRYETSDGLSAGGSWSVWSINIGSLPAGAHTFTIIADCDGDINESDETDNSFTKTITVLASPLQPNLSPYQSSGWSDKIVVSTWPWNENGSSPLYSTDALCLGFSVANGNAASTGTGFTNALYIDGNLFGRYETSDGLSAGGSWSVWSINIGSLPAGTYRFTIVVDCDGDVDESDETDNSYSKTITVLAPPSLVIGSPAAIAEGDAGSKLLTFTVALSAATSRTVTVNYATLNGTATAGSDYTGVSGVLTFDPAATSRTISVPILGDREIEGTQTFTVVLSGASNATIGTGSATGVIQDDDVNTLPRFTSPSAFRVAEGASTVGGVAAVDRDMPAQTLSYVIGGGADAALFSLDAGRTLRFRTAPNYETPLDADRNGVYVVRVTVGDGHGGSAAQDIQVTVVNVNEAPVLLGANNFRPITEDNTENTGTKVADLLAGQVEDPDGGIARGIAIRSLGGGTSRWQYRLNGDDLDWKDIGTVANDSAMLLGSEGFLRYRPDGMNGTNVAGIAVRAWDRTSGSPGQKVSTVVSGGSTAFSLATKSAWVAVSSLNDAPVLTGANNFPTINEDQITDGVAVSTLIQRRVRDVDTGARQGIAIYSTNSGNGRWEFRLTGGAWTPLGAVSTTSAILLRGDDRVRFVPNGASGTTASIAFRAWDQTSGNPGTKVSVTAAGGKTAFSAATARSSITVLSVNDAPVRIGGDLSSNLSSSQFNDPGILVATLLQGRFTDRDAGALQGIAVVSIAGNGTWQYLAEGTGIWTALGSASPQRALLLKPTDRVRFVPVARRATSATLDFLGWDQTSGTAGSRVNAAVNGGSTAFSAASRRWTISVW